MLKIQPAPKAYTGSNTIMNILMKDYQTDIHHIECTIYRIINHVKLNVSLLSMESLLLHTDS